MSEVHDSHSDTAELESFEEFEAEGRQYQNDFDLAVLMNSFGLADDNSLQSGPVGDQVAVAEAVYNEQRDDEHEGRVNESRSSGTRSANTFDANEDQVTFAGLVSTTPLVIDLDDEDDDEDEDERVDVDALEIYGNNDHAQEGGDLTEVLEFVNGDEGDAEAAAAAQLAYEIFDAPDSDDEIEVQVVLEAHATAFLDGVLSDLHAEQASYAVVEVQAPPASGYVSNIQILDSQTVEGTEEIIFETSIAAESVRDLLDGFMRIHYDIHSRLQSADDLLANVQVMKVNHVPEEVVYEIQVHAKSFTSVVSEMYVWVSERPSIGGVQQVTQHGVLLEAQQAMVTVEEPQAGIPIYEAIDVLAINETPTDMVFSPIDSQVTFEGVVFMEIDPHFDETDSHMTYCDEGVVCAYADEPAQVFESYGVYEYAEAHNFMDPTFDVATAYQVPHQGQFGLHSCITADLPQVSIIATQEGGIYYQAVYQADIQGLAHFKVEMDMLDAEAITHHQEAESTLADSHHDIFTLDMDGDMSSPLVGGIDYEAPAIPESADEASTAYGGKTNKCDLAFDLEIELVISGLRQLRVNDDTIFFSAPVETEYSVEQQRPVAEQVRCRRCESVLSPTSAPLAPPGLEPHCSVHSRAGQSISRAPRCSIVSLSCEPDFMDISPHLLQRFFTESEGATPLSLTNLNGSHLDVPTGDLINVNVVDLEDSPLRRGATPSPPPPYCPLPVATSADVNIPPALSPESHPLLSEVKLEPDHELQVNDLIANGDNGGEQESLYADSLIVPSRVNEDHIKLELQFPDHQPICVPPARRFDLRSKPTHQHHLALWSDEAKGRSHSNIHKPPKKKVLRALPLTPKRRFDMDESAPQPVKKCSLLRRTARFLTFGFW